MHHRVPQSVSAANGGTEQLQFLEELACLLRPESALQRPKTRPTPPAKQTISEKKSTRRGIGRKTNDRTGGETQCSDVILSPIDPRDFLNSAELALLEQRKRNPNTKRLETHLPSLPEEGRSAKAAEQRKKDSHSLSLDQPSSSRRIRSRSTSLSSYWLKESREPDVQNWLRRKEHETASRRLAEKRERRREKRKAEEKARLQQEREQLAKVAYQQWKERKNSEEKAKKKRNNCKRTSTRSQSSNSTAKSSKISHKLLDQT